MARESYITHTEGFPENEKPWIELYDDMAVPRKNARLPGYGQFVELQDVDGHVVLGQRLASVHQYQVDGVDVAKEDFPEYVPHYPRFENWVWVVTNIGVFMPMVYTDTLPVWRRWRMSLLQQHIISLYKEIKELKKCQKPTK